MKLPKPIRIISVLLSFLAVFSLIPSNTVLAAGNTLYVTPSSQSVQTGQSFTVQVRGDVATGSFGADTVSGTLQFPANLLQVTSVNTNGATFNWQIAATPGNGVVNFTERSFFPIDNTSVFVMAVTFKALASGTASVSLSGNSGYSQATLGAYPTTRSNATYTISNPPPTSCPSGQVGTPPNCTTPPPATCPAGKVGTPPNCTTPSCPSGQVGTPPNCTTPPSGTRPTTPPPTASPSTNPQSPSAPTQPVPSPDITSDATPDNGFSITDVTATRSYDSAVLNWKASAASKATVAFGTSLKDLNKKVDATILPDTTYEANLEELTPGKQYYYTITATSDADAAKTDSYSGVFTARGFPVVITITESKIQAANAKIKIGEQNYSTDKSGKISLELASGSYNIEVKTQKGSKSFTLVVAKKTIPESGDAPQTQRFAFDIPATVATSSSSNDLLLLIGGLIVGGLLLGGFFFWLWRKRQNQDEQPTTVITADNDYAWSQQPQQPTPAFPVEQPPIQTMPVDQSYAQPEPTSQFEPMANPDTTAIDTMPQAIPAEDSTQFSQDSPSEQQVELPAAETIENTMLPPQPIAEEAYVAQSTEPTTELSTSPPEPEISNDPPAEIIQTPTGSELQINHSDRHNSVYLDDAEPQDMFDVAKNPPGPSETPQ